MGTLASRFEDLGDVKELYHHNLRNVAAYLYSCGFVEDKMVHYKYVRVFIDKSKNRSIEVWLESDEERTDIVERIEFLDDAKGI